MKSIKSLISIISGILIMYSIITSAKIYADLDAWKTYQRKYVLGNMTVLELLDSVEKQELDVSFTNRYVKPFFHYGFEKYQGDK